MGAGLRRQWRVTHRATIQLVRSILEHEADVGRIAESDEAESTAPTRLAVLHDHAVDDLSIAAEVALEILLGGFPRKSTNEQFSKQSGKKKT